MADEAVNRRSLHRIARDHGLNPRDLAKAVRDERRKPVSDRMALKGEA